MNETEIFQHYQVLRRVDGSAWELGRGSMGVTYKAFDTDLHCEVTLKVILPQILHNDDSKGRFLREARLAARLQHPSIAAIFHLGRTADETYFYAMEFCEGETLQQIVEKRGPFAVAATLAIALQISRALVLANKHQLVHRDIKPANLILTDSPADGPTVKIIDFGLAKSSLPGEPNSVVRSLLENPELCCAIPRGPLSQRGGRRSILSRQFAGRLALTAS